MVKKKPKNEDQISSPEESADDEEVVDELPVQKIGLVFIQIGHSLTWYTLQTVIKSMQ